METQTKSSSVNVDEKIVKRALEIAKTKNLPYTLIGLVAYLLNEFSKGLMKVDYNPDTFNWTSNKRTSIIYDKELMSSVKATFKSKCLNSNSDFVVNFLLINFIRNY
jgi:hypothetical protein